MWGPALDHSIMGIAIVWVLKHFNVGWHIWDEIERTKRVKARLHKRDIKTRLTAQDRTQDFQHHPLNGLVCHSCTQGSSASEDTKIGMPCEHRTLSCAYLNAQGPPIALGTRNSPA